MIDPIIKGMLAQSGHRVILAFEKNGKQIIVVEKTNVQTIMKKPCNCGEKK